ncbi:MAG TPA: beta-lactamase family protein [Candidatus Bacteroides merdipullorum]|uniref:Beta-lactamase family protein n=1 Tax=Candidatus Bacteroides merdipullorum TaxID=2838474 RepID=A0A9D2A3W3_9BACE|nr:beta-lactamase family protein [Candidatus Bacteroides merdipullorum]
MKNLQYIRLRFFILCLLIYASFLILHLTKVKRTTYICLSLLAIGIIAYFSLPYYARQALIHLMPVVDDLETFHRDTVHHDAAHTCCWPRSKHYNQYQLTTDDAAYLDSLRTLSFLVIRHDSLLFESYRDGWNDTLTSNLYSATKTIVGLLTGIALDEGKIHSLDDPVSRYLPAYTRGRQADVTLRHLLTMSGGMAWDEAYASLFSVTTHGYYGDDLYDLVTQLDVTETPGVQFSYRSGETQLLAFALEAATGQTLSQYAEEKLWKPMQAERDAYWLLDKAGGDEKAFCCFHTTARDAARFGRLLLQRGNWDGRQLVSTRYMDELMRPASYLRDQWGRDSLSYYGLQTWLFPYRGETLPCLRGMLGQYIFAIPSQDAIVVRLGRKRHDVYHGPFTIDMTRYLDIAMKILR